MLLALSLALLFVFALGLVQAWTIWYLRRQIERLDARIGEALDDEDLLEFQERLQGLLVQTRETAAELTDSVDKRREALEASLERVQEAQRTLALKALERALSTSKPAVAKAEGVMPEAPPIAAFKANVKSAGPVTARQRKPDAQGGKKPGQGKG